VCADRTQRGHPREIVVCGADIEQGDESRPALSVAAGSGPIDKPSSEGGGLGIRVERLRVGQQLGPCDVEHMDLQLIVELETVDQPAQAAPARLEGLEARRMQHRAEALSDRGVDDGCDLRPLRCRGVGDHMRGNEGVNESRDARRPAGHACGSRLTGARGASEKPFH